MSHITNIATETTEAETPEYDHDDVDATYSVEDNKLRLYCAYRLDDETFQLVKKAGFRWAPKQELFVAPKWTPAREDICILLAGEIGPEASTMLERAEAKAERLRDIAIKREAQANAFHKTADEISQRFTFGQPILIGHHSERKARKDKERIDNAMDKAVKASKAVPYWNYRAEGVEHHANRKNRVGVRQRRIKTLLKELRDLQRTLNGAQKAKAIWEANLGDDKVKSLVGFSSSMMLSRYEDSRAIENGTLTPQDCRKQNMERLEAIINGPTRRRWITHVLNRLGYETSMIGPIPRYEDELTKVIIQGFARTHGADKPKATKSDFGYILESKVDLPQHFKNGPGALELSEDDWRDLMQSTGYVVEKIERRKSTSTAAKIPLINMTVEQSEKLQKLWNLRMIRACHGDVYKTAKMAEVRSLRQAQYSANSKGTYSHFKTIKLTLSGKEQRVSYRKGFAETNGDEVCRIRIYTGGSEFYRANEITVINDKTMKDAPLDWIAIDEELKETQADLDDIKMRAEREIERAERTKIRHERLKEREENGHAPQA